MMWFAISSAWATVVLFGLVLARSAGIADVTAKAANGSDHTRDGNADDRRLELEQILSIRPPDGRAVTDVPSTAPAGDRT